MSRPHPKPTTTIRIRTDVLKPLAAAADTTEARTAMGIKLAGEGPAQGNRALVHAGIILLTKEAQRVKVEEAKEKSK